MKNNKIWHNRFVILFLCFAFLGVLAFRPNTNHSQSIKPQYLSEKGKKLIENQLLTPLRTKMKIQSHTKIMSRCPSGLRHRIASNPSESNPYFMGSLKNYTGCRGQQVCDFRINAAEDLLEVLDKNTATYIDVDTWVNAQTSESLAQTKE